MDRLDELVVKIGKAKTLLAHAKRKEKSSCSCYYENIPEWKTITKSMSPLEGEHINSKLPL